MPVNYSLEAKNARLQAVLTLLGANAVMVIGTSALAGGSTGVLATVPLANPGFTIAGGVMTLAGTPRTVDASDTGTAAKVEFRKADDTVVISGFTVGATGSGAEVILNALAISAGQVVQVLSGAITHP